MKKLIALFAVLGVLLVAGCGPRTSAIQSVDPQTFLATAARPGAITIDVRTPQEFAGGHLQGAVGMNVEDPAFASQIATLDKNATYVVYCRSGRRSTIATDAMSGDGFTKVFNLSGGIDDLAAAGGKVVTW